MNPNVESAASVTELGAPTATETLLIEIWREVLQRDHIEIHDNFYQMGGHSLLAAKIASRAGRALKIEVPPDIILGAPTIAAMAQWMVERQRVASTEIAVPPDQPARAKKLLKHLDDLSDSEVEELLQELEGRKR